MLLGALVSFLFSRTVAFNLFECSRSFCCLSSLARKQGVKTKSALLIKQDRKLGCTRKCCCLRHSEELHNLKLP
jgi:hypothetical protein